MVAFCKESSDKERKICMNKMKTELQTASVKIREKFVLLGPIRFTEQLFSFRS